MLGTRLSLNTLVALLVGPTRPSVNADDVPYRVVAEASLLREGLDCLVDDHLPVDQVDPDRVGHLLVDVVTIPFVFLWHCATSNPLYC